MMDALSDRSQAQVDTLVDRMQARMDIMDAAFDSNKANLMEAAEVIRILLFHKKLLIKIL